MEKIINIDGRNVKFKSTASYLLRYKSQFGRDAIHDIFAMVDVVGENGEVKNISALNIEVFYNLVWTLAKTADPAIPPPMEWLDTFSVFPLDEIIPEVMEMILSTIGTTVESKKK